MLDSLNTWRCTVFGSRAHLVQKGHEGLVQQQAQQSHPLLLSLAQQPGPVSLSIQPSQLGGQPWQGHLLQQLCQLSV